MIEALNNDAIVRRFGGRFKLTALIQRRLQELIGGDRPLVERRGRSDFEVVIEEILQDKITVDWEASGMEKPRGERSRGRSN
jgi:DNA-directed RNA polymerase subunit omega